MDKRVCPQCGDGLPPESPEGLCPRCLLGAGLGSADDDLRFVVWDSSTGEIRNTMPTVFKRPTDFAFSGDGRRVAVATAEPTGLSVWDLDTDRLAFREDTSSVPHDTTFSKDGRRLAAVTEKGVTTVWNFKLRGAARQLRGHEGDVRAITFSPDARRVVTGEGDGTIRVWDPDLGLEVLTLRGYWGQFFSVGFSPDGRRLVVADHMTVQVLDAP